MSIQTKIGKTHLTKFKTILINLRKMKLTWMEFSFFYFFFLWCFYLQLHLKLGIIVVGLLIVASKFQNLFEKKLYIDA